MQPGRARAFILARCRQGNAGHGTLKRHGGPAAFRRPCAVAEEQMLSGLSSDIRAHYKGVLSETEEEEELWKYVKAADKMSAYIKCLEEKKSGNMDFADAEKTIYQAIVDMNIPEADYFIKEYIPAYMGTLDASGE